MGLRCVFDNLLEVHGVVRHDAERLAAFCCSKQFVRDCESRPRGAQASIAVS